MEINILEIIRMPEQTFVELTKKYFGFLIFDYGFTIEGQIDNVENPLWRGRVVFRAPWKESLNRKQTVVRVTLDRGYVLLDIGYLNMTSKEWLDLADIIRLQDPSITVYTKPDFTKDPNSIIEGELKRISKLTRQYCGSFLNGDFSLESKVEEVRANWREQTLSEWSKKRRSH